MKILVKEYFCPACEKKMNISKDKAFLDKKIFRCVSNCPKHDEKISLRINSVYENIKIPLFMLYFITFECYSFNKSINKTLLDVKDLSNQIKVEITTKNTIN